MGIANKLFNLGLDVGSVSVKCVIDDAAGKTVFTRYQRSCGQPIATTLAILAAVQADLGDLSFSGVVITGSGKELIAKPTATGTINEIVAHATAAWTGCPQVESIFEIGGQDSKYITIGRDQTGRPYLHDHAFNQLCAAGTGAFLDQQAERMGLTISRLAAMAASAEKIAAVAGRCSVFAKSDMIHLQQKAVPVDEIAAGLCFALARNYISTLCKGRTPARPILFQGGVAANNGVVRAFKELLQLSDDDLVVPPYYQVMGAIGSAMIARNTPLAAPLGLSAMIRSLRRKHVDDLPEMRFTKIHRLPDHPETPPPERKQGDYREPFFLGIDIGSVSTKSVLIDNDGRQVCSHYGPTASRPIDALKNGITALQAQLQSHALVAAHVVSTGSGRHIAKAMFGGGSIIDEISAQSVSCAHFFPEADTIIEIGGQDSKFIRLENGRLRSFKMNKACAAGTGAFLEEQAGRLQVRIEDDFAEKAFCSSEPARLGSKCTVFMDSDLVHHLQRGTTTEDLCAGLAYSIAENYLEKVVGSEKLGHTIVFQGGVARNDAILAVFSQLTATTVRRHPYAELSGAFGAAIIAREEYQTASEPFPLSLTAPLPEAASETFNCHECDNRCEIRKITFNQNRSAYFGGSCGKFEKSHRKKSLRDDAFTLREKMLFDCISSIDSPKTRGTIGIPLALTVYDHLPFWATLFNALGFSAVLSGKTQKSMVEEGTIHAPGDFCYPMKILFGHVHHLIDQGMKTIFIPQLRMFTPPKEKEPRAACPYTQAAPYVVREHVSGDTEILTLSYPVEQELKHWIQSTSEQLRIAPEEIRKALNSARAAQQKFVDGCLTEGRRILTDLARQQRRGAVLLGRPYNTSDRRLNLNIAGKLRELDIEPLPYDFLPAPEQPLPELWSRIRWGYGRRLVQSARTLKEYPFLGAMIVTNFGCGPDAFVDQYLEYELRDTPHLVLEFDDHQAEAGVVTRLEAFSRNFQEARKPRITVTGRDPGKPRIPLRDYTYYIPSFMDHAHAFTGALRACGCKAVLLPPTDDESWNIGMQHAYGKECHPFISFTGDLLKAAAREDFIPEQACYYGPSYFGPCLLPQYTLALSLILERIGLGSITVMNIADPTNMRELGPPYLLRLALGLYSIDRFFKWKTEILPYGQRRGEIETVYQAILRLLEEGLASGNFFRSLKRSIGMLSEIPLTGSNGKRQTIGVVGDIYTRVNSHSNNDLYRKLREGGFEVWPSGSLIDVSFLGMEQLHAELLRKGNDLGSRAARLLIPVIRTARWFVDRHFPPSIRTPQERNFHAVKAASGKYADFWIDKALSLNISRIEELHQAQADGVLHVMCHNCMLGNITTALTPSMRRDMGDIPVGNLIYEGLRSTHNTNRLEAFMHQVSSLRDRKDKRA